MTIAEKINRLKNIRLIVTNLTMTYDMGLEFTILTTKGAVVNLGNYGYWPAWKLEVSDYLRELHGRISDNQEITIKELEKVELFNHILSSYDSSSEEQIEKTGVIVEKLSNLDLDNGYFYAFVALEKWNNEIEFFDSKSDLEDYIISKFADSVNPYEEMDEESVEFFYNVAEDENWKDSIPFCTFSDNE